VINCSSPSNLDVIFANKNDTVKNCFLVFRGVAPIFPGGQFAPANASTSTEAFPFPLTALENPSSLLRYAKTHAKASKHSSKKVSKKHSSKKHSSKKG
jgi:hypothetical protein